MLYPKKVKHRKWFTMRMNSVKEAAHADTRGIALSFGSFGIKAMKYGRVTSNQIEAARKVMARYATKSGKVWIRNYPDHPFTQKPAEVKMGKGKGDPVGFVTEVKPGRIMFEIDGVTPDLAREALTLGAAKLPIRTKFIARVGDA